MAINGSISVSALFHDTDGTTAINVVSLRSANEYTTGKVAIITGTAGSAQTTIVTNGVYRDASGQLVSLEPQRLAFAWNGTLARLLENKDDIGNANVLLRSSQGEAAASAITGPMQLVLRSSIGNTGTYTIVLYGT